MARVRGSSPLTSTEQRQIKWVLAPQMSVLDCTTFIFYGFHFNHGSSSLGGPHKDYCPCSSLFHSNAQSPHLRRGYALLYVYCGRCCCKCSIVRRAGCSQCGSQLHCQRDSTGSDHSHCAGCGSAALAVPLVSPLFLFREQWVCSSSKNNGNGNRGKSRNPPCFFNRNKRTEEDCKSSSLGPLVVGKFSRTGKSLAPSFIHFYGM